MKRPPESAGQMIPENATLKELREAAAGCKACPLWENATQTVFGEGRARAELMFVGEQPGNDEDLPGVRMERWIIQNQGRYRRGVFLAVGDAFSLLTGQRKFAPAWMQRLGLTWVYRLCSEPRRLGPRYFKYNGLFLFYWFWDGLRGRGRTSGSANATAE